MSGFHLDIASFVFGLWAGAIVMLLATGYDLKRRTGR